MILYCTNTTRGLVPNYDDDFDQKKKLKIGQERFDQLLIDRNKPLNITIEEIKDKIAYYKQAVKQYLNN